MKTQVFLCLGPEQDELATAFAPTCVVMSGDIQSLSCVAHGITWAKRPPLLFVDGTYRLLWQRAKDPKKLILRPTDVHFGSNYVIA